MAWEFFHSAAKVVRNKSHQWNARDMLSMSDLRSLSFTHTVPSKCLDKQNKTAVAEQPQRTCPQRESSLGLALTLRRSACPGLCPQPLR